MAIFIGRSWQLTSKCRLLLVQFLRGKERVHGRTYNFSLGFSEDALLYVILLDFQSFLEPPAKSEQGIAG